MLEGGQEVDVPFHRMLFTTYDWLVKDRVRSVEVNTLYL